MIEQAALEAAWYLGGDWAVVDLMLADMGPGPTEYVECVRELGRTYRVVNPGGGTSYWAAGQSFRAVMQASLGPTAPSGVHRGV